MTEPVIFGRPWFDESEEELVVRTLRSGWIGQGPLVQAFERRFAVYVGAEHAVATSSCTAALHLSLVACGVGPGDEVITTPFTFVATVNAIEHVGATPVLVDIAPGTLNVSPAAVESAITERTRAIMPVHFGGYPLDVEGFDSLAKRHDLWVIEDAAHAVGGVAARRRIGASRHDRLLTCFSFYPNKSLAAPEGGAVTLADRELAGRIEQLRLHGLDSDAWKRYTDSDYRPSLAIARGFKYNWTDLQAAVGLAQLEKLEGFLAAREYLASRYDELLEPVEGVRARPRPAPGLAVRHALHLYQVEVNGPPAGRDRVVGRMRANGIGAAVHYIAVHRHPYYQRRFGALDLPTSDWASDHLLTVPLQVHMTERDVERVVHELRVALGAC